MPEISDLIEEYKKSVKQMVPDNQAELVDMIIDLGLKIGASIALEAQQRAQESDNGTVELPPEEPSEDGPQPMKCKRHCVNCFRGQCMIFNEDEIVPDTYLCERYEKYQGRNQWGV